MSDEELEPDIERLGNLAFKLSKHGITELDITTDDGATIKAKFEVSPPLANNEEEEDDRTKAIRD